MIAIIRIRGLVNVREKMEETLFRMRIRRKFSCVVVDENSPEISGALKKIANFVAYGPIQLQTLVKLIKARGVRTDKKEISQTEAEALAKEIMSGKKITDTELKPFFRLHPPIGGLKSSKLHYPKGVLGNHGENINKLIEKML